MDVALSYHAVCIVSGSTSRYITRYFNEIIRISVRRINNNSIVRKIAFPWCLCAKQEFRRIIN